MPIATYKALTRTYKALTRLSHIYWIIRSQLIYPLVFKRFGRHSVLVRPLLVLNPEAIEIEDHVAIRQHARLEVIYDGTNKSPTLRIGRNTTIEQRVHISCHCRIDIGARTAIAPNVGIFDTWHPHDDVDDPRILGSRLSESASYVEIGDDCLIGIGVVVLPNVKIGANAIIGSNSVVTSDIPAYSIAVGAPARVVKRYDPETRSWVRPGATARI